MEQNEKLSQSIYFKAILRSVLLGLIGCLLYGIMFYIGFISFLGAYAIYLTALYGYKNVIKQNMKKKDYLITFFIALVELVFTIIFIYVLEISRQLECSFSDSFLIFFDLLSIDSEFLASVLGNFIISFIFLILGIVSDYISTRVQNKRNQNAEAESVYGQSNETETLDTKEVEYDSNNLEDEIDKRIDDIENK